MIVLLTPNTFYGREYDAMTEGIQSGPAQADKLPRHVAIIMDGNNRWARAQKLSGSAGHRAGAEAAKTLVNACLEHGIAYLTLFAFSSENWLRPRKEVNGLMALFLNVLRRKEIQQMHKNNVRLQFIGNRGSFSEKLQRHMLDVEELTAGNTGTVVTVAADYGGRWDIARACQRVAAQVRDGELDVEDIGVDTVGAQVSMNDLPMPDLCIRTGGEQRISNFLLWQLAYTELYFTSCYWPDFDSAELQLALDDYARRQRRYGHRQDDGNDGIREGGHHVA